MPSSMVAIDRGYVEMGGAISAVSDNVVSGACELGVFEMCAAATMTSSAAKASRVATSTSL